MFSYGSPYYNAFPVWVTILHVHFPHAGLLDAEGIAAVVAAHETRVAAAAAAAALASPGGGAGARAGPGLAPLGDDEEEEESPDEDFGD